MQTPNFATRLPRNRRLSSAASRSGSTVRSHVPYLLRHWLKLSRMRSPYRRNDQLTSHRACRLRPVQPAAHWDGAVKWRGMAAQLQPPRYYAHDQRQGAERQQVRWTPCMYFAALVHRELQLESCAGADGCSGHTTSSRTSTRRRRSCTRNGALTSENSADWAGSSTRPLRAAACPRPPTSSSAAMRVIALRGAR